MGRWVSWHELAGAERSEALVWGCAGRDFDQGNATVGDVA